MPTRLHTVGACLALLAGTALAAPNATPGATPDSTLDAAPHAAVVDATPQWITLGTGGGPLIRRDRSEPANALVIGRDVYLFDVGSGVERQMVGAHIPMARVRAIFISHHHIDHNADLGQVMASRWMFNQYTPMPVIGPPGTEAMVDHLSEAMRAVELAPIGAGAGGKKPIRQTVAPKDLALNMDTPTEIYKDGNIRVLAITNTHYHFAPGSKEAQTARSYAFRVETKDRTFVYTGDTGPSRHVEQLAQGADVLISEVIDIPAIRAELLKAPPSILPRDQLPEMIKHMEEDHLTPVEIGKLAAAAKVKSVVLTHLAPGSDGETDLSGYTNGIAPTYGGPVTVAKDLQRF
jgi:ribonuclease BN (tRNA processing enzyme)